MNAAALYYAQRGWPVLPANGKRPLTERGLHDATTNPEQIRHWWARWPTANVAIRTGVAFHVLDMDGPEGMAAVRALLSEHGRFRKGGPFARTSSGRHIHFAPPSRRVGNRAGFIDGCDWRGEGGYVIAPPSVHPSGRRYEWMRGPDGPLPPVPRWLLDLLDPPRPSLVVRRAIVRGSRYAEAAFDGEVRAVALAPEGCRNDMLNRAAFNLGTLVGAGLLEAEPTAVSLIAAARTAGLPEREATRTVTSGLNAGLDHPRKVK